MLLKAFSFIRKAEHKSSENLQPANAIEKKIPFSEEKFKPAGEICLGSKAVNSQEHGENVSFCFVFPLHSQAANFPNFYALLPF